MTHASRTRLVTRAVALLVAAPAVLWAASGTQWWQQRVEPAYRMALQSDDRVLYAADTDRSVVALTIDDGPDPATTGPILDLLAEHGARATFFLISDQLAGNGRLVKRMVAEGHEIGNHMTADTPSIDLGATRFERRLLEAHARLSEWQDTTWFRPASGFYDQDMIDIARRHGYRTVLGRVYPLDAAIGAPGFASRFILWRAGPGEIIILHDGDERGRNTLATLREVLPRLKARGLEVVTLSELTAGDSRG